MVNPTTTTISLAALNNNLADARINLYKLITPIRLYYYTNKHLSKEVFLLFKK